MRYVVIITIIINIIIVIVITTLHNRRPQHQHYQTPTFITIKNIIVISGRQLTSSSSPSSSFSSTPKNSTSSSSSSSSSLGGEFCYGCAAPVTPIVAHDNSYHRPKCFFYSPCCDSECTGAGGKPYCKDAKYSVPCKPCQAASSACLHTGWSPCHDCRKAKRKCTHWCLNCERLGKICSPPGNPNDEFTVFSHEEIIAEEKRSVHK